MDQFLSGWFPSRFEGSLAYRLSIEADGYLTSVPTEPWDGFVRHPNCFGYVHDDDGDRFSKRGVSGNASYFEALEPIWQKGAPIDAKLQRDLWRRALYLSLETSRLLQTVPTCRQKFRFDKQAVVIQPLALGALAPPQSMDIQDLQAIFVFDWSDGNIYIYIFGNGVNPWTDNKLLNSTLYVLTLGCNPQAVIRKSQKDSWACDSFNRQVLIKKHRYILCRTLCPRFLCAPRAGKDSLHPWMCVAQAFG